MEDELERKLLTESEKRSMDVFIEFSVDMLLRGDIAARMKRYETLSKVGAMTPNEIRMSERMSKSNDEAADKLYMNLSNSTIDANKKEEDE